MPVLSSRDALGHRPGRILVAGASGAGKTTLASRLADLLEVRHTELDALFHGPGWTTRASFQAEVLAFSAGPTWVTEWQYSSVQLLLAGQADTLVWLDFRRTTVMWRVVRRTLERRWRRELLWNDNVERPLWTIFTDPDHIVRWAWRTHPRRSAEVLQVAQQHRQLQVVRLQVVQLQIVRLRSPREVEQWLSGPLAATLGRRG